MMRTRPGVRGLALVVIGLMLGAPCTAHAHGSPPDLAFFGPFGAATVHCMRVISAATRRCTMRAFALQRDCLEQQLSGQPCDQQERDANIAAAINAGQQSIARACLGGQLTELRFNGLQEVDTDLMLGCTSHATAIMSMVYRPALYGSTLGSAPGARACMASTDEAGRKLLDFIVRRKNRAFDRMGVHLVPPAAKRALLNRIGAQIGDVEQELAALVASSCPSFVELFGETPLGFLTHLASRGDCIVGTAYVQTEITCPTPVCGNGIKETGEPCDDGNRIDNDGCHNDCTLGP